MKKIYFQNSNFVEGLRANMAVKLNWIQSNDLSLNIISDDFKIVIIN